jgi:hypothetical protein
MGAFFAPMFPMPNRFGTNMGRLGIPAVLQRIGSRRVIGWHYGEVSKNVSITASICFKLGDMIRDSV